MENERRKTTRWYTCPVCGHEWSSTGYQKRVFCPKCYETRTGKKLGGSPEHMAAMRGKLQEKRAAAATPPPPPEPPTPPVGEPDGQAPEVPETPKAPHETIFDRIFNKRIL